MVTIACIAGTRPELIKIAPVMRAFQKYPDIELVFTHSGQHHDQNMLHIFIHETRLPPPDENIEAGLGTHGKQTAKILVVRKTENSDRGGVIEDA